MLDKRNTTLLKVECSDFNVALNCTRPSSFFYRLPTAVAATCCEENPKNSYKAWYRCCEALVDNGLSPSKPSEWENSSYQAYVMGVAVFAILMCLFVSGTRSVRRRRALARLQQRQNADGGANTRGPEFSTQVSLGPPSYGELEAGGLTKDYKTGAFNPPPYPGIIENTTEGIEYITIPANSSSEEPSEPPPALEEEELEFPTALESPSGSSRQLHGNKNGDSLPQTT